MRNYPHKSITFNDIPSSYDGLVLRFWNFGDRSGSSEKNPAHTYYAAGAYNVSLQIFDADGINIIIEQIATSVVPSAPELTRPCAIQPSPE